MIPKEKIPTVIVIAVTHFVVCCVLGAIVIAASIGYTMSDYYEPAAWWYVALDHTLLFLEAPAGVVDQWPVGTTAFCQWHHSDVEAMTYSCSPVYEKPDKGQDQILPVFIPSSQNKL